MSNSFDIRTFKSELAKAGVLRGNRFTFFTSVPPGLQAVDTGGRLQDISSRLPFMGEMGVLPGSALLTHDVRRYGYGPNEKKPYGVLFNDVQLLFRVDAQGDVYDFFRAWMGLIVPFETGNQGLNTPIGSIPGQYGYQVAYKADYATDVSLTSYDETGAPVLVTNLRDAYPIAVGDLPHDWGAKDYVRLPVTMTFIDWFSSRPSFAAGATG